MPTWRGAKTSEILATARQDSPAQIDAAHAILARIDPDVAAE